MKYEELQEMTEDELQIKEAELKDQLFKLRFQHSLGQLENPLKMKRIKKDIARIKTLLSERSKVTE
jgi:large subunit ribosomal protein L29